jgi:hypothetical protein
MLKELFACVAYMYDTEYHITNTVKNTSGSLLL